MEKKISGKTRSIEIDGKEYISISAFMERFLYVGSDSVRYQVKRGLPCVRLQNRLWFNEDICRRWYAGEL